MPTAHLLTTARGARPRALCAVLSAFALSASAPAGFAAEPDTTAKAPSKAPPKAREAAPPAKKADADKKGPVAWGYLVEKATGKRHPLVGDRVVVGSGPKADVRVASPTIAARHARLEHKDGIVHVRDLRSRYGTLLAGTQIKKGQRMQLLQPSPLTLGAVTLDFVWGDRGDRILPMDKKARAAAQRADRKHVGKKKPAKRKPNRRTKRKAKRAPGKDPAAGKAGSAR